MQGSIKKQILAIATLTGTTIGVGVFSLPYIATRVGLLPMILYLIVLTFVVLMINLLFAEVSLKTPDFLRLPGYAKMHLGKPGKIAAIISTIIGSVGTLLAYITIGGGFLAGLLKPQLGGSDLIYIMIYFLVGASFIYLGTKVVSKIEFWGMVIFFFALLFVFFKGFSFLNISNFIFNGNLSDFFLPYGAILFALWGATMVPELEEMLGDDKKKIKKVITIGTLIPAVCYLLFILLIISISGLNTTKDAITGIGGIVGQNLVGIMFLAGFLATFTSFITIGLNLKKVLLYDIKLSENLSWALTCFVPLVLLLLGLKDFLKVIGFVGGVALAMEGILILLMHRKVEYNSKKHLIYGLLAVLLIGIVYEIIYFFI